MDSNGTHKKRGRPRNAEFNEFELKRKLREIALSTDEELNPNKLAKLTGIERRNWNKILPQIEAVNNIRVGNITPNAAKNYPLPNTEEVFSLYGGNDKKLKEVFQSLINLVSNMWEKCLSYDSTKLQNKLKVEEKDRQIDELIEKLKQAKEDIDFYKAEYRKVCGESIFSDKRKELGILKNVVKINRGDKNVMDIDALDDALNSALRASKEITATKKED